MLFIDRFSLIIAFIISTVDDSSDLKVQVTSIHRHYAGLTGTGILAGIRSLDRAGRDGKTTAGLATVIDRASQGHLPDQSLSWGFNRNDPEKTEPLLKLADMVIKLVWKELNQFWLRD